MKYNTNEKTIKTNKLLLRLFRETDATEVAKLCNNYNLYKNTLYLPYPYCVNDALSWMANHEQNFNENRSFEFAITDKYTGKLYGAIALTNNQRFNNGEIAYWVGEEFWGRGYATEAAKGVLRFAFVEKKYNKVFARYFNSNSASGKVLERIGMKKEGVLKEHVLKEDRFIDLVYCGILKSEYNLSH